MTKPPADLKPLTAIGLMSGTSMDGIDVALVSTDGEALVERGPGASYSYDSAFRARLLDALQAVRAIRNRTDRPGDLAALDREIAERHANAIGRFLAANAIAPERIDIIGFHGQTMLHRPRQALTVQIGDAQRLADLTGIAVIHDLRANDMAHGGQGAPLVPAWHAALGRNLPPALRRAGPVGFVNIGGIANVTWIGGDGAILAFDTGPGNALIDQWMTAKAGLPFDEGGNIALQGRVIAEIAARYLDESFFQKPPPKSLDRNDFPPLDPAAARLRDGARTLAHVTAAAIAKARDFMPAPPAVWILCGGGRSNRAIVAELAAMVGERHVALAEEAGLNGDAMEAEAWAYLAVRSLRRLPITWPATTGVREPASGGVLARPRRGR
jgi:anhydro-N-acetylmuramic acid kinase